MKNEKGFTLLEMLISFCLFLMIISFIPILVPVMKQVYNPPSIMNEMEWEIFMNQLSKEYRQAKHVTVQGSTLTLSMHDERAVVYEQFENKIRRRVNSSGHEVVLQYVKKVYYKKKNHQLNVQVINEQNQTRQQTITNFLAYE
ncbi:competence protein ComG [Priestia megaterium]|nr:competence protein ComG [Priestia megaterium]